MSRTRSLVLAAIGVGVCGSVAAAQIVVTDPAVTIKNAIIATLRQQVLDTATQQAAQLRRMVRRLSAFADLSRYAISDDDTPKWRIHLWLGEQFLYANPYNAALNYGDRDGAVFEQVARERVTPGEELAVFGENGLDAEAAIAAQLATLTPISCGRVICVGVAAGPDACLSPVGGTAPVPRRLLAGQSDRTAFQDAGSDDG